MLSTQLGRNPDPCGTYNAEHLRHHKIAQRKLFAKTVLAVYRDSGYWNIGYWDSGHG